MRKLLIGTILAMTMGAQGLPPLCRTGGEYNGRMWRLMSINDKSTFVMGYDAAVHHMEQVHGMSEKCLSIIGESLPQGSYNMGEIAERLDTFYKSLENRPLPISWALMALSGSTSEEFYDRYVLGLRALAATLPQEPQ